MYKKFCFCCKRVIETTDEKEFTRMGHVGDKNSSITKYHIHPNRLLRDLGRGV